MQNSPLVYDRYGDQTQISSILSKLFIVRLRYCLV
jgi:hypothetical protein